MAVTPIQPDTKEADFVLALFDNGFNLEKLAGFTMGLAIADRDPELAAYIRDVVFETDTFGNDLTGVMVAGLRNLMEEVNRG